MKNSSFKLGTLSVVGALFALTGCHKSTQIVTSAAGHPITAMVEGTHSVDTQPTGAVIRSEFGKVTIERTRVQLDSVRWTTIPQHVPVRVSISSHKQWLSAGPVTITQTSQ
jgi:hypothetical protein